MDDVIHKKSAIPNKKIIFECWLEDWLIRLRIWTAL